VPQVSARALIIFAAPRLSRDHDGTSPQRIRQAVAWSAPSATMTHPACVGAMFQAGSGSSAGVVSDSGCENACTWAQVVALV